MDESHHQHETDHSGHDADSRPSFSMQQYHNDEGATPENRPQQKHSHARRFRWPSAQVWFDLFLVVFTGALVVTSYLQWHALSKTLMETKKLVTVTKIQADAAIASAKAAQDSNALAQQSLQVTQRAYVGVHSLSQDLKAGQIGVMLENIGKVPAQDIKVYAHEMRISGEKIIGRSHPILEAGHTPLFPGTFKMQVVIALNNFVPEEISNILTGKERLSIAGKIQYGDGFGNIQYTDFAFFYRPPPNEGWAAMPIVTFDELQKRNPE